MVITKHARKAIKKRLGLPKKAIERRVEHAEQYGLTHKQLNGRLRRYVDYLYLSHGKGNGVLIHNRFVFIIDGHTLITMYGLPNKYKKLEDAHYEKYKK